MKARSGKRLRSSRWNQSWSIASAKTGLTVAVLAVGLVLSACSETGDPFLIGSETAEGSPAGPASEAVGLSNGTSGAISDGAFEPPIDDHPPFTVVAHAAVDQVAARVAPEDGAAVVADLSNPTAVGGPLVFRAVEGSTNGDDEWVEVHLPVQPNGTTGWIRRSEVTLSNNPYRIEVDRAGFTLRVFRQNVLWLETPVAIGTGATPTPVGDFYLMELLAPSNPGGDYGPFAFGLSGFSEVLESFGGADSAIIGLHGTNDPSSLGATVSHGCVRIENSVIERLASNVPLGTPVLIT